MVILILSGVHGQGQANLLDGYIQAGLENNLALRQKQVDYTRSLEVLKQARSYFYPDLSINMRYSVAEGGRLIEFPVGTMLNPVYQSLNFLLGQDLFPDIENMEFAFYRPTEHETKISLVQPIVDARLYYNSRIKKELTYAKRAEAEAYQRQLVAEIKAAYFNYLKSLSLVELLNETRILLEENIRVNESLYSNDKDTIDYIYRSRAELSNWEKLFAEGRKNQRLAAAYFNFLLNRPLETPIEVDTGFVELVEPESLQSLTDKAVSGREELEMLESYSKVADNYLSLNQVGRAPSLYAAVDYGFQGVNYEFNGRQDYLFASLVLRWQIFQGFQRNSKVSEARIEQELRQNQLRETEQQIRLQAIGAYYDLVASGESIEAAEEELNSNRNAFRVVDRKYREGQASLIELIDARTNLDLLSGFE